MASHGRKLLLRILDLKEPFTGSSRASRREVKLWWRFQDVQECPASCWGDGYGVVSPPVQSCLNIGSRWVRVHLHAQWGEDFWTTVLCCQQRSHFSPRKSSWTNWNSAGSTRIGQRRTGAKLFSLMKPPSDCMRHLENWSHGEEKVNAKHESCVVPTVKHPETIYVWGCFSSKGMSSLLPTIQEQFVDDPCIFQHDGAPCYKTKAIMMWSSSRTNKARMRSGFVPEANIQHARVSCRSNEGGTICINLMY